MHLVATANGQRAYRNKKGNTVFVYAVEGTPEEIAEYKTVKAQYLTLEESTDRPLFHSLNNIPLKTRLVKNRKGDNFYADIELVETAVEKQALMFKGLMHATGFSASQMIQSAFTGTVSSSSNEQDRPEPKQESQEDFTPASTTVTEETPVTAEGPAVP